MLSEALQNAEDGRASNFSLSLDLRHHDARGFRISGPAFLLSDNGEGFGDRNWTSLQNLHASEKRQSPTKIGKFGMGSR